MKPKINVIGLDLNTTEAFEPQNSNMKAPETRNSSVKIPESQNFSVKASELPNPTHSNRKIHQIFLNLIKVSQTVTIQLSSK